MAANHPSDVAGSADPTGVSLAAAGEPTDNGLTGERPPVDLRAEQEATLSSPRRSYGIAAKVLFATMDLLYGKPRTLSKFKVLEIIARVPTSACTTRRASPA